MFEAKLTMSACAVGIEIGAVTIGLVKNRDSLLVRVDAPGVSFRQTVDGAGVRGGPGGLAAPKAAAPFSRSDGAKPTPVADLTEALRLSLNNPVGKQLEHELQLCTVEELRVLAKDRKIKLGKARNKQPIVERILAVAASGGPNEANGTLAAAKAVRS